MVLLRVTAPTQHVKGKQHLRAEEALIATSVTKMLVISSWGEWWLAFP
ncbi:hypothetical protein L914_05489 [Phytophthora nicotianae]|uniref:Uncharacterized protein n=1 Tax=Phytophthora nicotianae TaxID=4792 RepID=W2NR97_PHYNI|nr:hypothetical protein L914_05489 [Phytophthora nicotianae]